MTIELARLLEGEGFTGRVVLIDGAPEFLQEIKNQQLPSNSNSELQTNFLLGVMDMVAPTMSGEVNKVFQLFFPPVLCFYFLKTAPYIPCFETLEIV